VPSVVENFANISAIGKKITENVKNYWFFLSFNFFEQRQMKVWTLIHTE